MNKLIVALVGSAFAFGSAAVFADGSSGPSVPRLTQSETQMYRQQRAEARAALEQMTPEQRAAMRKAAAGKKQMELSTLEMMAQEGYDSAGARIEAKAAVAQSKAMAAPTKQERAADLNKQIKSQQDATPAPMPKK
ncbi:MAG: hypothetical protein ABI537_11265 [Casimicrobiaceae bacterium]